MKKIRQVVLVAYPKAMLSEGDFAVVESEAGAHGSGELLVRVVFLSADPYLRLHMNPGDKSFRLKEPLHGYGIGQIEESDDPRFKKGEYVTGTLPWADYAVLKTNDARIVYTYGAAVSTSLGLFGMTGLTAYFGMLDIGKPHPGETAVISGAAGAVGSIAGQIARIKGCRTVGITGSASKCLILAGEFGFDAAVDYRNSDLENQLDDVCPDGVDIFFDNVGGAVSDAVLQHINKGSRIVICGQISLYNTAGIPLGPRPFPRLLAQSSRAEGFMVHDYTEQYENARIELSTWLHDGLLHYRETVIDGLENAPKALCGLFSGSNIGKQLIRVSNL